jgi:hypothetical protein
MVVAAGLLSGLTRSVIFRRTEPFTAASVLSGRSPVEFHPRGGFEQIRKRRRLLESLPPVVGSVERFGSARFWSVEIEETEGEPAYSASRRRYLPGTCENARPLSLLLVPSRSSAR